MTQGETVQTGLSTVESATMRLDAADFVDKFL